MSQGIFLIIVLVTDKGAPFGHTVKHAPTRASCKGKVGVAFTDVMRHAHD